MDHLNHRPCCSHQTVQQKIMLLPQKEQGCFSPVFSIRPWQISASVLFFYRFTVSRVTAFCLVPVAQ
jgi:hypothetical protein